MAFLDSRSILCSDYFAHTVYRREEVSRMATQKEIHELIGRMVADPDFRASLLADPEKAVTDTGYDLTEEQLAALKKADLKGFSTDLDERLSKEVGVCAIGLDLGW